MACQDKKQCDSIDIEVFEHLSGKHINWDKRDLIGKVISERVKGHIKLYDSKFIAGETYKKNGKTYRCEHIDQDGTAMLVPRGKALKVIATKDATDWEIL